MTAQRKGVDGRVLLLAGAGDVVIGAALMAGALTGRLGDGDVNVLAGVGGFLVLVGVGIVVWGLRNLDRAGGRPGDTN